MDNVAEKALQIHDEVWAHLEVANAKYKAEKDKHRHMHMFQEGDLMMVCLWRRLFRGILAKLEKWKHGPFQVEPTD